MPDGYGYSIQSADSHKTLYLGVVFCNLPSNPESEEAILQLNPEGLVSKLPVEILSEIFLVLPFSSGRETRLVCCQWKDVSDDCRNRRWKKEFEAAWGVAFLPKLPPHVPNTKEFPFLDKKTGEWPSRTPWIVSSRVFVVIEKYTADWLMHRVSLPDCWMLPNRLKVDVVMELTRRENLEKDEAVSRQTIETLLSTCDEPMPLAIDSISYIERCLKVEHPDYPF